MTSTAQSTASRQYKPRLIFWEVTKGCNLRCIHCRATATELMDGNRMATKFRAPGCMAKYLAAHPEENGTIFVTDYATGKWIRPEHAMFVPVVLNRDTGESDYRAFFNKSDAEAAATALRAVPVDWATVMERARS